MSKLGDKWNQFEQEHAIGKGIREGGLFVVISNLITLFKYLLLTFLPAAFAGLPMIDFGWPGIPVTLFGESFLWNIIGYDVNLRCHHHIFPNFYIVW